MKMPSQVLTSYFSYNTDEVAMYWSELGVSKMREKMELADYLLTDIENVHATVVYTIICPLCSRFLCSIAQFSPTRQAIGTS